MERQSQSCGVGLWSWTGVKAGRKKLFADVVGDTPSSWGESGIQVGVSGGRGLAESTCLWLGGEIWIRDLDLGDIILHLKSQRVSEMGGGERSLAVDLPGLWYEPRPRRFAFASLCLSFCLWCLQPGYQCFNKNEKKKKSDYLLRNVPLHFSS